MDNWKKTTMKTKTKQNDSVSEDVRELVYSDYDNKLEQLKSELQEKEKGIVVDDVEAIMLATGNDYSPSGCECPYCHKDIDLKDVIVKVKNRAEISSLKKGISACEEALSQRNKEIFEIIDKWIDKWNDEHDKWEGEGEIYEHEIEDLKKQLTTEGEGKR